MLTYTLQHLVTLIQDKVSHRSKLQMLLLDQLQDEKNDVSHTLRACALTT